MYKQYPKNSLRGNLYTRKQLKITILACGPPSQPDLHPYYYKKTLKGHRSYEAHKNIFVKKMYKGW